jgi:hypothetical protein
MSRDLPPEPPESEGELEMDDDHAVSESDSGVVPELADLRFPELEALRNLQVEDLAFLELEPLLLPEDLAILSAEETISFLTDDVLEAAFADWALRQDDELSQLLANTDFDELSSPARTEGAPTHTTASLADVADWMRTEVERRQSVPHAHIVRQIRSRYGLTFLKPHGSRISDELLDAFAKVTQNTVVWVKRKRIWRLRKPTDPPGRQAD